MSSGKPGSFRRSLAPGPNAAFKARQALDVLRDRVDDDLLERSRLVVTEVVTNAVLHAKLMSPERIDVHVRVLAEVLRIEVTDQGTGFDPVVVRRGSDDLATGGWGLWLVDQLTDRWGVDHSHSTRVWLEFDRDPA